MRKNLEEYILWLNALLEIYGHENEVDYLVVEDNKENPII